jgi:general stress protein 26
MARDGEIVEKFWKALQSDMTLMLGLAGVEEGHSRPMTAQMDGGAAGPPIWFFTAKDTELVQALGQHHRGVAHFASKGHELFATLHGMLVLDDNRATIERLWNPFVSAWYPGGRDDPSLALLRFEPEQAQVWLNENSLFTGVKMLLGADPKNSYRDKVAKVNLSGASG